MFPLMEKLGFGGSWSLFALFFWDSVELISHSWVWTFYREFSSFNFENFKSECPRGPSPAWKMAEYCMYPLFFILTQIRVPMDAGDKTVYLILSDSLRRLNTCVRKGWLLGKWTGLVPSITDGDLFVRNYDYCFRLEYRPFVNSCFFDWAATKNNLMFRETLCTHFAHLMLDKSGESSAISACRISRTSGSSFIMKISVFELLPAYKTLVTISSPSLSSVERHLLCSFVFTVHVACWPRNWIKTCVDRVKSIPPVLMRAFSCMRSTVVLVSYLNCTKLEETICKVSNKPPILILVNSSTRSFVFYF